MKQFTFFSMSLLIMLAFSTSCETTSSDSGTADSEAVTEDVSSAPASEINLGPQELSSTDACNRIRAFVDQPSTAEFPCYFTLSSVDIAALLSDTNLEDSIFAMIGYHADLATTNNIEKFELIFAVREVEGQAFRYYDFTQPCPAYCPTIVDNSCTSPPTIEDLGGNKGYWFKRSGITCTLNSDIVAMELQPSDWDSDIIMQGYDEESDDLGDRETCNGHWEFQPCGGEGGITCSYGCQ